MSDNVISFTERLAQRRVNSNDDPKAAEEKQKAADRMKLREIRKQYEKPDGGLVKWKSREDRLRAAQALGKLIEKAAKPEAGKPEVTIATMKKKWREANNYSEFHIHRYMISPEINLADPQIVDKHAKKFRIRSVMPYAKRARFIAELANLDPEESEIAIFRNTSLWRSPRGSSPTNNRKSASDDAADKIAFLLEKLSGHVIRESALADLFRRMRRVPGQLDIRTGRFRASSMACLFQTAYQGWFEFWGEIPPLPSVPLVRFSHAGLRVPVRLSSKSSTEPYDPQAFLTPVRPDESEERQAELNIFREIRLALGPTVQADALGPMFESRAYAELNILGDDGKILSSGALDFDSNWNLPALNPKCSAAVFFDNGWHRFTPLVMMDLDDEEANTATALSGLHVESPFMWDCTPLADEKGCFEQWYISWTPVDAGYVTHWLDQRGDGRGQPVEFLPDAPEPKLDAETWYPMHVLAHLVEKAIYDGRLEAALQAEIARIRNAFETHEVEWRIRMQEQTAELIAEFDSDL